MDHLRQLDIVHPDSLRFPITLVGAGGIGSLTALALAKMGCSNMEVWDHDNLEEHNMPNQFYEMAHIGGPKVTALYHGIQHYTGTEIKPSTKKFKVTKRLGQVIIVAVDSMRTRKSVWNMINKNPKELQLLIDARMGGEQGMIITCDMSKPSDKERYAKTLYSDENSVQESCTGRAIIYNVLEIAAKIAKVVQLYAIHMPYPREIAFSMNHFANMVEW